VRRSLQSILLLLVDVKLNLKTLNCKNRNDYEDKRIDNWSNRLCRQKINTTVDQKRQY